MIGEWKQVRTENMVEYMTAEGNSKFNINMAQKFNPNMEIRDDGNGYVIYNLDVALTFVSIENSHRESTCLFSTATNGRGI